MTYPLDARQHQTFVEGSASEAQAVRVPLRGPLPRRRTLSRPYNVAWLSSTGDAFYDTIVAPAIPLIESACANVVRGTVISTSAGPVPVEDLSPGMPIETIEHGPLPLQWVGSYDMSPRDLQSVETTRLYRVTAEAFGLAKPAQDLMLAPHAHIVTRHAGCQKLYGVDQAFAPIRAFEDGVSVIAVKPMSTVSVFNLAFDRQATICANGVEVESFHPGPHVQTLLDDEMMYALLRLFPQVRNLDAFGAQVIDRLTTFETRALREGA